MTCKTEKRKMILLHSADDNAIIICDPGGILYVAPSPFLSDVTMIHFARLGVEPFHLDVRETPKEIASLADWTIRHHSNYPQDITVAP